MMFRIYILIRRIIYVTLGTIGGVLRVPPKGVVVFCYHSIAEDVWRFSENFDELKKQIEFLRLHRKAISIDDLFLHVSGKHVIKEPSFLIAFDDGYKDILRTKEYFKERGIKPVSLVLGDSPHANQNELGGDRPFLSLSEIQELKKSGWDIGCHSMTHQDFSSLSKEERDLEIIESKLKLESILGFPIKYFAYPKGVYSDEILQSVKQAGYNLAFSMDEGFVNTGDDPMKVFRIGVDRTHSFIEFKYLTSPLVISFRQRVKYLGALLKR
ncbi:MAG: polysaccharide deacetylase family protein [bacterium]|nr:polysaccharide deacetylase family protein [bacterium]